MCSLSIVCVYLNTFHVMGLLQEVGIHVSVSVGIRVAVGHYITTCVRWNRILQFILSHLFQIETIGQKQLEWHLDQPFLCPGGSVSKCSTALKSSMVNQLSCQ